jgi:hypothetical protein
MVAVGDQRESVAGGASGDLVHQVARELFDRSDGRTIEPVASITNATSMSAAPAGAVAPVPKVALATQQRSDLPVPVWVVVVPLLLWCGSRIRESNGPRCGR